MSFQFAIDRGGTFTDVFAKCPSGKIRVMKLLSVDPQNYPDAPTEGIRRILELDTGNSYPKGQPIDTGNIEWIRMGTTVATNALLERKGQRMALVVTEGFKDLLFIGNQTRPNLFELDIAKPSILYEEVVEVEERVFLDDPRCQMDKSSLRSCQSSTSDKVFEAKEVNVAALRPKLQGLLDRGITSLSVVLMHSYLFPEHEQTIGTLAESLGFTHVSLSSQVMPMVRIVPRGFTATVDAYLTPCIKKYLQGFSAGFKNNLAGVNVTFMQSDGGLTPMESFIGSRAIISGPAGGVVGYARTSPPEQPVIGFDMGGTSTDVSRYHGEFEHVFETTTAGVTVQAPQLDVNTVAAGGGSMLAFRSGLFSVGPESAGAHPGPACYRKGGPLTITDANLSLGRILPKYFPKIFGPKENEPLDDGATKQSFEAMTKTVNEFLVSQGQEEMSPEAVAMGFIRVANEAMCRPIRALTQGKGFDARHHSLACFGGAGGQHACAIARSLGMKTVYVHKYAGILSAYGMALADVVTEVQVPCSKEYASDNFSFFNEIFAKLERQCSEELARQGFEPGMIELEPYLHMRYEGTDCALMCTAKEVEGSPADYPKAGDFLKTFLTRYQTEFGFVLKDRKIVIDDIRVRGVGKTKFGKESEIEDGGNSKPSPKEVVKVFFESGYEDTGVYLLQDLLAGHTIPGPAIIIDGLSTVLVEPNCTCFITKEGNLKIDIGSVEVKKIGLQLDTIQLSIFSHRFMSIAEQMGRVLQRTSISTNIKERLDFSCALFGPDGGLVSNAPHIPVHLGAMQDTVRHQMKVLKDDIHQGDVLLANHPKAGGSHLPDLTIITPVFVPGQDKPVFFVANRGHHADIGGISPGSMPPHSKHLWQEGASFKSFKIIDKGTFREKELIQKFEDPGKYPGSSGTRCLQDNLSDLKAQIAANQKGINLVTELIDSYGLDVVQAYMFHIQSNAEIAVRDMLKEIGNRVFRETGKHQISAVDFMDDGSKLNLKVDIDLKDGSACFDFTGSGTQVWGNTNAPRAVTFSALIYCLRCMVGHDIPLNQGCLNPVKVVIPEGSILDPSEDGAVVGGNVLTSQRLVDVVFRAFEACSASQGCCNNITFGDDQFG